MGEELETYILKKLDDAITESKASSEFHFAARLFLPKLHKEFTELKDLIEKKRIKIKQAAAAAAAAAAAKKESTSGPSSAPARPHQRPPAVKDPAANVAKTPDASKPSAPASSAVTGAAATGHDSSAGGAKEESKVLLPAVGVKKSQVPPDAGDGNKTGAPTDAANKKAMDAPLDAGTDKKDTGTTPLDDKKDKHAPLDDKEDKGASSDAGGDKDTGTTPLDDKDTGAPLDASGDKDTDTPLDDKEDKGAPSDAGGDKEPLDDKEDKGAPSDAGGDKEPLDDKEDTGAPLDAGDDKEPGAPLDASDDKEPGAQDAGDDKESASDVDKKDTGAPSEAGDKKDRDAPLVAGDKKSAATSDVVAGDKKEIDAPLGDVAGDKKESASSGATSDEIETGASLAESAKKESDAPLVRTSSKTVSPNEPKASTPATVTSGGAMDQHESDTHTTAAGSGKKVSNVGTSATTTSQVESEITPATDAETDDKSVIPPASVGIGEKESKASKTATLPKTSKDESEISPVNDDNAADHKSKTPTSAGGGKKEPTKSDSNTVVSKPVNEEDLLREQLYYLNNVLTEWQMITKKPFSYSSDSLSSMKDLSKTLKKIKQDLKEKPEDSSHSGIPPTASSDNASLIRTTPEAVEFRWSTRLVNLEKVHGFEDKILSLERLLVLRRKDTDAFKAFGIHGMAGVGKTTLCQSIFNRPRVSEYFFPRIWVCLSKQRGEDEDNKKEVVKRVLRCLGIDDKIINKVDEKQGIRGLLFALRLQLTGKRYFIVLDDAHNADEWFKMPDSDTENDNNKIYEKFSYGLPKECGGTVIVTSRVEQVVKNMVGDEENLRCIEPLTDKETCWKIFKDTVEEDGTPFPEDLNKLELEIVKRCDGLPLAAKLLGQIKHKELRENPTLAVIQRAAVQAGNQPAAVQAGNQHAAVQAAK